MRILAATDFSPCGDAAVAVAGEVAQVLGEGVVILHAYEPAAARGLQLGGPEALDIDRQLEDLVTRRLEALAAPLRQRGLGVGVESAEGSAPAAIEALAERMDARMVVVGSRGQGAMGRWVTGSVADRVVRSGQHPVLAVRGAASGFEAWRTGTRPLRVVVGIDPTAASDEAIAWVGALRQHAPVDVTFVHVFWPPVGPSTTEASIASPDPVYVGELEARFREQVGTLPGQGEVTVRAWPALGSLAYALSRWADEVAADLIVVGNEPRGLLERLWRGSAATGVLHHARVSVLMVPARPGEPLQEPAEAPEAAPAPTPGTGAFPPLDWEASGFEEVLVPLDLSHRRERALQLAAGLARRFGGTVTLFHAVALIPGLDLEEERAFYRRMEQRASGWLERERARLEAEGVRTRVVLRFGEPAQEIAGYANETGVDLVVLGSHPLDPEDPAGSLGTVSYKVGVLSTRPVLLVK